MKLFDTHFVKFKLDKMGMKLFDTHFVKFKLDKMGIKQFHLVWSCTTCFKAENVSYNWPIKW